MRRFTAIFFTMILLPWERGLSQSLQHDVSFVSIPAAIPDSLLRINVPVKELNAFQELETMMGKKTAGKVVLGYTLHRRPVEAWYFPGTSNENAMVIGGMHGSELSSVEVALQTIELLGREPLPYYNVIIIPVLFPDNAATARLVAGTGNHGRYTTEEHADPNRQMPGLGKKFDYHLPHDHAGRPIETENQLLLGLVQEYNPSRIVNLHAIKDVSRAGVYADPRTDCNGVALGFTPDSTVAINMAGYIHGKGGRVPGNSLDKQPTALYFKDPAIAPAGHLQKRNLSGSQIKNNRGYGVSLGGWATTAVCDSVDPREAMMLITMEFPGYRSSDQYPDVHDKKNCRLNVSLFANSIRNIFLEQSIVD